MPEYNLEPCPFFGCEAKINDDSNHTYSVRGFGECRNVLPTYYVVQCTKCGAMAQIGKVSGDRFSKIAQKDAEIQAVAFWNRRVDRENMG